MELPSYGNPSFTVPTNKRFEIRYVNGEEGVPDGTRPNTKFIHTVAGSLKQFFYQFLGTERHYVSSSDFVFSEPVLISAGPGDRIGLTVGPQYAVAIILDGYLLNA